MTPRSRPMASGSPCAMTRPKSSTDTRSHTPSTSDTSCSTSSTAIPQSSASRRTRWANSAVSCSPSPAAGSSSSSTDGSVATARASATSRRLPNDSSSGRRSRSSSSPNSWTTADAAALSGALPGCTRSVKYATQSRLSAAVRRFSRTVIPSKSSRLWNERPMPATARLRADQLVMSTPSSSTRPAAGFAKPVSASTNVDLPAPLGPMSPSTSRGRTVIETPSSASTTPKRTRTPSASSVLGVIVGRPAGSSPAVRRFPMRSLLTQLARPFGTTSSTPNTRMPRASCTACASVEDIAEQVGHDGARRERGADQRADHVADAADDRVEHDEDRLEHREGRPEDDARAAEPDEHATDPGYRGPEPERIELRPDDAYAESRRGPLVRAHGDEPSTGAAATQVRDPEGEDDEADEREHRVPLGMGGGVEVEPEERHRADLRSRDAASASGVVEDQALDDERQTQRSRRRGSRLASATRAARRASRPARCPRCR